MTQSQIRRHDTLEKKRNVLIYHALHPNETVVDIAKKFNVQRTSIYKWKKRADAISNETNLRFKKRVSGGGRKPESEDYEEYILMWIKEMERNGHPPSRPIVKAYMKSRFKNYSKKTLKL